jgi:folate-binding protein YgfZ
MLNLATEYHLLRDGAGAAWLERDVVSVSGPAAVTFLQGQCSQDVVALPVGGSSWTWVLQPQGKVEALCRLTKVADDRVLLDTDGGWGEALALRLNRFKLRTKADIEPASLRCLAVRGPDAPRPAAGDDVLVVDAGWSGWPGYDLLGAAPEVPEGVPLVGLDAFEVARIEAGVPRMGAELTEKTIPAETGLIGATVSFTKGCYTGQELVARIDSRGGNVPRHLRRIVLDEPAPAGAELAVEGKKAGTLTSVAAHPDGGAVGLAYLSRDVVPPARLAVSWDGGATSGRAEWLSSAP